jgi:hypothetical protein
LPVSHRTRSVVVAVILIVSAGASRTSAQDADARPRAADAANDRHREIEVWALSGVDAAISERWSAVVRTGYAGGFDSAVLQTDISYARDPARRLIVGHLLVNPTHAGAGAISILRAGGAWLPLSGRVELEHQGLVERLAGDGREFFRLRNRLRLTLGPAPHARLRALVSAELFSVRESALVASRYQAGAMLSGRHMRIELYLVRQQFREQRGFTALGASAIWTAGRRR